MTEPASKPDRPPFSVKKVFLETPFAQRFQGLLRHALRARSWHVIAAVPGSGKSWGIRDLVNRSGAYKEATGETRLPLLAIRAPENGAHESVLGVALSEAFGVVPTTMAWSVRRAWLVKIMASAQVEGMIVDDAQDLTPAHLALLKKLIDNLEASPYQREISLCLVAAHNGSVVPFKDTFARPEMLWQQYRRRMDTERPFCIVPGHTEEEIRHILTTFEDIYRDQLPDLQLRRWAKSLFHWLTNPVLDPNATGRVTMDHLTRLVTSVLRQAYEQGATDVNAALLERTADLLILRRDEVLTIDETISPLPIREVG